MFVYCVCLLVFCTVQPHYNMPHYKMDCNITVNTTMSWLPNGYLRYISALTVICCIIIQCLEVSGKEDQIMSVQR